MNSPTQDSAQSNSQVQPQGSYTIEVKDNILMVHSHGPFNEATVLNYSEDVKEAIALFNGKPWVSLNTFYGNGVFTPDAEAALNEMTEYRIKHGMIALAAVITNSSHADLQQMQLHRIYHPANITFHVFSGAESAENWLRKFLKENS